MKWLFIAYKYNKIINVIVYNITYNPLWLHGGYQGDGDVAKIERSTPDEGFRGGFVSRSKPTGLGV